jgi:hypothetical protein
MVKNEQKVMDFVQQELAKDPGIPTVELFERAKKVDTGVAKLTLRQFNARFPLQVKRKNSMESAGGSRRRRGAGVRSRSRKAGEQRREAVREIFLRFAGDVSGAEEPRELIRVITEIDVYVDQAIKAAGR